MQRVNLEKAYRNLYQATRKPEEVQASRANYLCIPGRGGPESDAFQDAIDALYAVAHALQKEIARTARIQFKLPKLECLWPHGGRGTMPAAQLEWQLLIRIPDSVEAMDIKIVREALRGQSNLPVAAVRRYSTTEGYALQSVHVGPYDSLGDTVLMLMDAAERMGYRARGTVHEVYLNSPHQVPPRDLQTIVRIPVEHSSLDRGRGPSLRGRPTSPGKHN